MNTDVCIIKGAAEVNGLRVSRDSAASHLRTIRHNALRIRRAKWTTYGTKVRVYHVVRA